MNQCPCGSHVDYYSCCGLYHTSNALPQTPEALMRSRYTAYALANMAYIKKTMQGKPLLEFNDIEAARWAKSILWLGLKIIKTYQDDENTGYVEFIASYLDNHSINAIHEISQFKAINNSWYYIDGKQIAEPAKKIPRNTPCPCGSKKKFKNCHAQKS